MVLYHRFHCRRDERSMSYAYQSLSVIGTLRSSAFLKTQVISEFRR